jgi:hypothetical protein
MKMVTLCEKQGDHGSVAKGTSSGNNAAVRNIGPAHHAGNFCRCILARQACKTEEVDVALKESRMQTSDQVEKFPLRLATAMSIAGTADEFVIANALEMEVDTTRNTILGGVLIDLDDPTTADCHGVLGVFRNFRERSKGARLVTRI